MDLEVMLFVEDLMKYVFERSGLNYVLKYGCRTKRHSEQTSKSPFRFVIGNAVCYEVVKYLDQLDMFHQQFKTKLDVILFRRYAMKLVPDWFPEGYHPLYLIEFCVMMISTAVYFHYTGYHEISSCVGEVIAVVLTRFMLTGEFKKKGGWEKLVKLSTKLVISHEQTSFEDGM